MHPENVLAQGLVPHQRRHPGHKVRRVEEGTAKAHRMLTLPIAALAEAEETGKAARPVGAGIRSRSLAAPEESKLAGEAHDEFLDFVKVEAYLTRVTLS